MANNKLNGSACSIGIQKSKVKQGEYSLFENGMFNPICPKDYNYATGCENSDLWVRKIPVNDVFTNTARLNGTAHISI